MEIKAELIQPYTEEERIDFIIEQNHNKGYEIRYVDTTYEVEETQISYETQEEEYQDIEYTEENGEQLVTKTRETQVPIENKVMVTKEGQNLQAWGYTEEEIAEKEKEAIAKLSLTRGDVFRGLLKAKGVTKAQIRAIIEQLPEETNEQVITKELALIDFDDSLNFYRGVALIDVVGAQLGISSDKLDKFFETNDYRELLDSEEE